VEVEVIHSVVISFITFYLVLA